jgi:hypothetical protein
MVPPSFDRKCEFGPEGPKCNHFSGRLETGAIAQPYRFAYLDNCPSGQVDPKRAVEAVEEVGDT